MSAWGFTALEKSQIWEEAEPSDKSLFKKSKFGNTNQNQVS